mgnify:CR=1 FL=1
MKKLITLLAVAILLSLTIDANAVPRRYLVEDHTGGWCQYCPIGIEAIEKLRENHKDLIIPIAAHSGDAMENEFSRALSTKFGISSFPSGIINRKSFTYNNGQSNVNGIKIHPAYWPSIIQNEINKNEQAVVDVRITTWNLDKETKVLTATIEAEMMEDVPSQLAFNLLVMEDAMSGDGSAWRQVNSMAGNPNYKDSRFFDEPSTIYNFQHDNVLLYLGDGANGSIEGFPTTAVKGATYTRTYTINLSNVTPSLQNPDNIWIAAIVHKTGSDTEVLNCIAANKKDREIYSTKLTLSEKSPEYINIKRGNSVKKSFTIQNPNPVDLDYSIKIDSSSSLLPDNWTVTSNTGWEVNIKAGETKTVELEFTSDASLGKFALYKIRVKPVPSAAYVATSQSFIKGILSDGADIFVYTLNGITPAILNGNLQTYSDRVALIPFVKDALTTLDHSNAKLHIFLEENICDYIHNYDEGLEFGKIVQNAVENKIPMLISSEIDMFALKNPTSINNLSVVPSLQNFFNNTLKIEGYTGNGLKEFVANNSLSPTTLILEEHPVNATFGEELVINDNPNIGYSYYGDIMKSTDPSVSKIIMNYSSASATDPTGAAAAITLSENKALYFGFSLDAISDLNKRATLLNNSITWLLEKPSSVLDLENSNIANIKITPNPTSDYINVTLSANPGDNGSIYINDMQGSVVKTILNNGTIQSNFNINVTDLSSGKYYIVTDINGIRSISPVVITK